MDRASKNVDRDETIYETLEPELELALARGRSDDRSRLHAVRNANIKLSPQHGQPSSPSLIFRIWNSFRQAGRISYRTTGLKIRDLPNWPRSPHYESTLASMLERLSEQLISASGISVPKPRPLAEPKILAKIFGTLSPELGGAAHELQAMAEDLFTLTAHAVHSITYMVVWFFILYPAINSAAIPVQGFTAAISLLNSVLLFGLFPEERLTPLWGFLCVVCTFAACGVYAFLFVISARQVGGQAVGAAREWITHDYAKDIRAAGRRIPRCSEDASELLNRFNNYNTRSSSSSRSRVSEAEESRRGVEEEDNDVYARRSFVRRAIGILEETIAALLRTSVAAYGAAARPNTTNEQKAARASVKAREPRLVNRNSTSGEFSSSSKAREGEHNYRALRVARKRPRSAREGERLSHAQILRSPGDRATTVQDESISSFLVQSGFEDANEQENSTSRAIYADTGEPIASGEDEQTGKVSVMVVESDAVRPSRGESGIFLEPEPLPQSDTEVMLLQRSRSAKQGREMEPENNRDEEFLNNDEEEEEVPSDDEEYPRADGAELSEFSDISSISGSEESATNCESSGAEAPSRRKRRNKNRDILGNKNLGRGANTDPQTAAPFAFEDQLSIFQATTVDQRFSQGRSSGSDNAGVPFPGGLFGACCSSVEPQHELDFENFKVIEYVSPHDHYDDEAEEVATPLRIEQTQYHIIARSPVNADSGEAKREELD
ncbi:unnamed protein product [Amoebophrya sp. A25]|nr:unnamed protein product [Amoebophrya sp. A25]|eukprot:GSA25T00017544001.1